MRAPVHPLDDDVREHVAVVAAALNHRLVAITLAMREVLATRIGELNGEDCLVDLLGASIAGNVENILYSLQYGITVDRIEPPSAALEYARRLAQRGVPVNALVRAYRLGQQYLLQVAYAESLSRGDDQHVQSLAYEKIVTVTFDYIDWISQQVVVVYENERECWLADRQTLRRARIEALITGTDLDAGADIDSLEHVIGYRLRSWHLAAVIWVDETGARHDQLRQFAGVINAIAEKIATNAPLVVARDRANAWAWLPVAHGFELDTAVVGAALGTDEEPQPTVAFGRPGRGLAGFRQSHLEALDAQRVQVLGNTPRAVISYDEPGVGVAALLAQTPQATRRWVHATLFELARDDERHGHLRDTLRLFLQSGCSYTATADAMYMHKNSIKYRVANAEKALGRSIGADRQSIELALTLCHWLGRRVLL
ncbi:MAG: PucR family transcriptional regulator [Acidimicrobiales bacterium]